MDKSTEPVPISSDNEEKKAVSQEHKHTKTTVEDTSLIVGFANLHYYIL